MKTYTNRMKQLATHTIGCLSLRLNLSLGGGKWGISLPSYFSGFKKARSATLAYHTSLTRPPAFSIASIADVDAWVISRSIGVLNHSLPLARSFHPTCFLRNRLIHPESYSVLMVIFLLGSIRFVSIQNCNLARLRGAYCLLVLCEDESERMLGQRYGERSGG